MFFDNYYNSFCLNKHFIEISHYVIMIFCINNIFFVNKNILLLFSSSFYGIHYKWLTLLCFFIDTFIFLIAVLIHNRRVVFPQFSSCCYFFSLSIKLDKWLAFLFVISFVSYKSQG